MATVRLQLRRGTDAQWVAANPILAAGELGVETDTRKVKIGDGSTAWNSLDYIAADSPEISEIAQDAINDALVAGTGITKSYDDNSNTITVSVDTSVIATKAELAEVAQDSINDALTAGTGITKSYNDAANTLTVSVDTGVIATQSYADQAEADAISTASADATSKANAAQAAAEATASAALSAHQSDTTNIHGIADTSILVTTTGSQTLSSKSLLSPTLTGTPTAPTASAGTDSTQIATTAFVQDAIELVVGAAPEALNTLSEIATSLNNDADLAGTLTSAIAEKVAKSGDTMTGDLILNADPSVNLGAATKQYVDSGLSAGAAYVDSGITNHNSDTTNVHGIANTANLVTTSILTTELENYATVSSVNTLETNLETDISNHISSTTGVHGIADTSALVTTTTLGEHTSLTTGVHGIADTSALVTTTTLAEHTSLTTGVHGIADVSALVTETDLSDHTSLTTGVHGISDTSVLVTTTDLSNHTSATTNVHGIADTASLVTLSGLQTLTGKTLSAADNTITINAADIVDVTATAAELNILDGVTATAAELNTLDGVTASTEELNILDGVTASTAELNYVDGVTSAIQTQIDSKSPTASPTFTGTVVLPSTTSVGNVSSTEIGYLDGVTSAIQTQLNAKALDSDLDAHTGASTSVHGISDTAQLAYLNAASQTFTGNMEVDGNMTVDGNLTVNGTTFNASATSIVIEDNIVQLAHENTANSVDLGIVVAYNDGTAKHSGIVRDVSANKWKLFKGVTSEPSTTVDFTQGSLDDLEVAGLTATSLTVGSVSNTEIGYLDGVTSAIQTQIDAKAPSAGPTFTGTVTLPSTTSVGNVSSTELGYLDGVTSAIQTQLNAKAPTASPTFTGTVTVAASGIAFTDGTQTKEGVPSITPISTKASSYTLGSLTDRDGLLECTATSGTTTITIPTDATLNFPIGTSIDVFRFGAGEVTVTTASGATLVCTPSGGTNTAKLRAQYSTATLFKRAANAWVVFGDLKA